MPDSDKSRFLSAVNYDLIRENETLRISLTRWQLAFQNLQIMLETAMQESDKNADVIEELRATGDGLCILAANEMKALQDALVICRLDRDYWISEHEKERELSDVLHAVLFNDLDDDVKAKLLKEAVETYNSRRGK